MADYMGNTGFGIDESQEDALEQTVGIQYHPHVPSMNAEKIHQLIQDIKRSREQGQYEDALASGDTLNQIIKDIMQKKLMINGIVDVHQIKMELGWLLAYTCFNLQDYERMERYIQWEGVKNAHPWAVYLLTIGHRIQNVGRELINKDLYSLLAICNDSNLDRQQQADVNTMIGDLLFDGYGDGDFFTPQRAEFYFKEASQYGNMYAVKMLKQLDQRKV